MSMVEMDLFAFDFSQDQDEMYSDENVLKQFKELQLLSKRYGNGYCIGLEKLPNQMMMFIDKFVENGWIERRGSGISVLDEHLIYHTLDEVISTFENSMNRISKKENVCWYKDVISVINFCPSPIRWLDEPKKEYNKLKNKITLKYALQFGLEHFKNVPSSRGMKMLTMNKWAKKNVMPIISNAVLNMSEYEEIEKYFRNHAFFLGRRDWDKSGYTSDYHIPPYPEFIQLLPTTFDMACMLQAETSEDIELILEYVGHSRGSTIEEKETVYPNGWSFEKYIDSLTDEDKELLQKDRQRLASLHNRDIMKNSLVFKNI